MGFDVVITAFPSQKRASVTDVLEVLLGVEPDAARLLMHSLPSAVIRSTTQAHAQIAASQLREAGATVEVVDPVAKPAAALENTSLSIKATHSAPVQAALVQPAVPTCCA